MPSILDTGTDLVHQQLDQLAADETNHLQLDVTLQKAEVEVGRTWSNGWGVYAWARHYWSSKDTQAGVRVKKTWTQRLFSR